MSNVARRRAILVFPYRASEPSLLLLRGSTNEKAGWEPVFGSADETSELVTSAKVRYSDVIAGCRRAHDAGDIAEREQLLGAALRELEAATGIDEVVTVVDLGVETDFVGQDGNRYAARAFAAEVPDDTPVALRENTEGRWVGLADAKALLSAEASREALHRLTLFLDTDGTEPDAAEA